MQSLNQTIHLPILKEKQVFLSVKREDLLHPTISGNKYRKLKYNLVVAKEQGFKRLLTFGGAYSNHIAATAYAGKLHGFKTIGVIRGEELINKWQENPTLRVAHDMGMRFKFVSRNTYRNKNTPDQLDQLKTIFGNFYVLPEGGTNPLAVKGCQEILGNEDRQFDVICVSVGTGGTIAGICKAASTHHRIIGFPALKGDFIKEDIRNFTSKENWNLQNDYHFGGYAKVNEALIHFINDFKLQTTIPLDAIYTGKLLYGILDLVKQDYFAPKTNILAIHTGGLQGIAGMNQILQKKKLPQILI